MTFNGKLLDGMVIFTEVIKTGSFTNAALSSGHSTSYISKEINKLEARLGVRLLHRTTRSISLTPEGELYYRQCQQIIGDAEQLENAVSGRQSEPKGELRISCPLSFGLSHIRPILSTFLKKYPLIDIELDLNDRKVDVVADGFDVVLRASGQLEDSSLICQKVMSSHGVTIASPQYLEEYGIPAHPNDLIHHRTICYRHAKQPNIWGYLSEENQPFQVPVNSRVVTSSPEMELSLCLDGQGITRLPKFILTDEIETGKLVPLFTDLPPIEVDIYLVYPSRKYMSSKVKCFIDFIKEELGN